MPEKHPATPHLTPADLSAEQHDHYELLLNEIGDNAEVSAKLANPKMLTPPYIHYIFEAAKDPDMHALYKEMADELALLPVIEAPVESEATASGVYHHID